MRCAQPFQQTPWIWLCQSTGVAPCVSHRLWGADSRGRESAAKPGGVLYLLYMPSIASAKCAVRLLRLSLSVGVMKVFSIVHGAKVRYTARGTA